MKIQYAMTAVLMIGVGACSTQPDNNAPNGTTGRASALAAAPAAGGGQPSPATKAAAASKGGAGPTKVAVAGPPPEVALPPKAPPSFETPSAAAAASMGDLANLVATGGGTKRGFSSAAEVTSSALADGLPVSFVGLNSLTAFKPGADSKGLATDTHQILYPISVGNDVRSSVTVQQGQDGKWQAVRFGRATIAKTSHSALLKAKAAATVDSGSLSLIEIPTVHAYLLSYQNKGTQVVTPLVDIPGTSYKAGEPQPAAEVFAALQPIAASLDASKPN